MSGLIWYILSIVFLLSYNAYIHLEKSASVENVFTYVNGRLESERSVLDWKKIRARLKRKGILDKHPSLGEPSRYVLLHLLLGMIGIGVGLIFNPLISIAGFIVGLILPTIWANKTNKRDNADMLIDIIAMNNALITSIRGGAYITDAMYVCEEIVVHPRLKRALVEFRRSVDTHTASVREAIEDFESRFDSIEIGAMCLILKQGLDTGKLIESMTDLSRHCESSKQSLIQMQKTKVENAMTIAMLIMVADVLGFIAWRLVSGMLSFV